MYHHSRLLRCRNPQGAVPCGTTIRFAADAWGDDGATVSLRFWRNGGGERFYEMRREGGRVVADVPMPDIPCVLWYFFVIHTSEGQTFFYGADSGEGMFVMHEPQSYQVTVYDGAFSTPAHLREGIAYQIFPDRFKRSSWEDFYNRARYHTGKGRFLRLHDRWSEPLCIEPSPGQRYYSPDDFYGGDLAGIREKLPYLASLGVTLLYLNPIFESPSNHRYDTADYNRVDPLLGGEDDLHKLTEAAKGYGIRVMLDGVFSHTGADSRYFDKLHRYDDVGAAESADSPYYGWYRFTKYPDEYDCWWGFPTLPNVDELNESYCDFITGENGVLRHWANAGATSWRLDVADELPDEFIRRIRKRVKQDDPEAVLMGEVWEDCSNKFGPEGLRGYVYGDELDCAMNYPFTDATIAFLTGRMDANGYNHAMQRLREHYPRPFYEACFNLLGSHDIVRPATALSGAPDRNALNRSQQRAYTPLPEDAARGKRRLVVATALQCALPGVPCVYYGDEAGMTGMADPFNRGTYPWGNEDAALLSAFRALLQARKCTPALSRGLTRMGALSPDVFAVVRYLPDGSNVAVLLLNRSEQPVPATLRPASLAEGPDADVPAPLSRRFFDALTGEPLDATEEITLTLPPVTAKLLIEEESFHVSQTAQRP